MKDLFKILAALQLRGVYFCFQAQGDGYTNLSVDDPKGKNQSYSAKNFDDVELFLKTMWGHVLTPSGARLPEKCIDVVVSPSSTVSVMPVPPNFPMPPR